MQKYNGNYYKMRMTDERFIVNEERGIVVCRQKYAIGYVINGYDGNHGFSYEMTGEVFTVTGVARCSKDDKFDERTGRMISQTKANIKAYGKYKNWARSVFAEVTKLVETCGHTFLAAEDFENYERKKLDELVKGSDK